MRKKQTLRSVESHLSIVRKTRNALLIKDVIGNSSRAKALKNLWFAEELDGIAQCVSGGLADESAAVAIANVHESSLEHEYFTVLGLASAPVKMAQSRVFLTLCRCEGWACGPKLATLPAKEASQCRDWNPTTQSCCCPTVAPTAWRMSSPSCATQREAVESPMNAFFKFRSTMSVSVEFRPLMPVISA